MKIYSTLNKEKTDFIPINKNKVLFYQCGPTVYWNQHIGNLRSVVLADVINRSFRYFNYEVVFVRNYTDVGHLNGDNQGDADSGEDRMQKASEKENLLPEKIAKKYIDLYEKDTKMLNIIEPEFKPKATDYIEEQKKMVLELFQEGFAYATDLAIYFDVSRAKNYYKLSGQKKEFNICGAGSGDILDKLKKNKEDFALWFFKTGCHKKALQSWEFIEFDDYFKKGKGFPGWHLECSAMTRKILGESIDLKMGGIEHISIHHTNEIAQTESLTNKNYANFYLHNEHLLVNNKKMSKSEGSSYLLSDILDKGYKSLDLRFLFLQAHYRSKQNFTWESLKSASIAFEKIKKKLSEIEKLGKVNNEFKEKFSEKIKDDFNTPEALAVLYEVLKSNLKSEDKKATILDFDKILGLKLKDLVVNNKFKEEVSPDILNLLEQRLNARNLKNWEKSDQIRDLIFKKGYNVIDTKGEQKIEKI